MSVRVTTLANGVRVATDTIPHVETASVGMWVGVGTRDEAPEVNGIAHMLEHMAFKGTKRRSAREIAEAVEDVGGHLNAYTSREQTAYYARVLSEDVPLAVDILSDILQHSVFDDEELKRERAVILQEIGQANDTPDDIIFDHFQETAFPEQPLGRPVLGRSEIVERLGRNDLTGYMGRYYGGNNMVAIASGKVDHDRFVGLVQDSLSALPPTVTSPNGHASYTGGRFLEDRDLEQVHVVLGFPGVSYVDDDYYVHSLYSMVLGGGMSSRLFQEVREKRGLVYSIYSFASSYRDSGLFGIYAGTGEAELNELSEVIGTELLAAADGITQEELDRARAQLRAGTLMARESTSARAESLAQQILIHNRPVPVDEVLGKLDAVTLDDLRRVGAGLVAEAPTVATLGPAGRVDPYDAIRRRLA